MEFLVTAFDADGDFDRRLQHRASHLDSARGLAAVGHIRSAGAILDEEGRMVGSTLHMSFPSRDDLQTWLDVEPYMVHDVWQEVEVREIRLVDFTETATPSA